MGSIELKYVLYQVEGVIMFIPNLLIIVTVINQNALRDRKEYLLIASQAVADALQGTALFAAGFHRTLILYQNTSHQLTTMSGCAQTYFNAVWLFSDPLTAFMMMVTSLDRLVAVVKPLRYRGLGKKYAYTLLGVIYVFCLGSAVSGQVLAYIHTENATVSPICATSWSVPPLYYKWFKAIGISGASASIGLYVLVFVVYMYRKHQSTMVKPHDKHDQIHERKMQHRLTQSLGITTAATFFLYILPMLALLEVQSMNLPQKQYMAIAVSLYMLTQTNSIINLAVYYTRLRVIRHGLQNTLRCNGGQLPSNLGLVQSRGRVVHAKP